MGPIFAETLRARMFWLLALLVATVVAFVLLRPSPPERVDYSQFERVGTCVDGKWVYSLERR